MGYSGVDAARGPQPRSVSVRRRNSDRLPALIPYRTTRDIDILIEPTIENAAKVRAAVGRWGGFELDFTVEDFVSGDTLSFGGLLRVEVHSDVPGVTWEQVWAHKMPGELRGVPTSFAGLDELIAMKEATARPDKDESDVARLRKLKDARDGP